ncbi:hypothetical protein BCR34DRAFT_481872, partial [Clohesyomyces aquaticus]
FERHSRRNAATPANLDFDARVPIPFSVFPSSYRSDAVTKESTKVKVEGEVQAPSQHVGREGHEEHYESFSATTKVPADRRDTRFKEEVRVYEEDRVRRPAHTSATTHREEVHVVEKDRRYPQQQPEQRRERFSAVEFQDFNTVHGPATDYAPSQIDVTERQFREGTRPIVGGFSAEEGYTNISTKPNDYQPAGYTQDRFTSQTTRDTTPYQRSDQVRVEKSTRTTVDAPKKFKRDMGYYDEDGHYHSFRHGLHKAADKVLHPIHGHRHHHSHSHSHAGSSHADTREEVTISRPTTTMAPPNTITIPCHHIRIGDLLILQGRPCQVIRITTSSQTGQHRYLGVDLFTKQLHEESSFISNPAPSVMVQNMLGPVFKQYRVLDIREDGRVVAMTETGDVKQGLPVLDQSGLLKRLSESFDNGRGSVRILVINDDGMEMAVDYKVVHGSRL